MAKLLERRRVINKHILEQNRETIELCSRNAQIESLAQTGMIWAMTAHELNNLLTPVKCYAELAMAHPHDKQLRQKALRKTAVNSEKAVKLLNAVMELAKGRTGQKEICSVKKIVQESFTSIGRDLNKDGITAEIDISDDLQIFADKIWIEQVLINLILNARDAMMENGGRLTVSAQKKDRFIALTVKDTGKGINPENIKRIFEPFFTTKSGHQKKYHGGSGLGLALCRKITKLHGGNLTVSSDKSGSTFTLLLPGC